MPTDNVSVARRWIDDLLTRGDLTLIDVIVAPDFVGHAPGGASLRGRNGAQELLTFYHTVFADVHWTIEDVITAGDRVVLRGRGESVYLGGWHGIPSTRQRIVETSIAIFRIVDGLIRELWFEVSDLDVAHQLGAFPPA